MLCKFYSYTVFLLLTYTYHSLQFNQHSQWKFKLCPQNRKLAGPIICILNRDITQD